MCLEQNLTSKCAQNSHNKFMAKYVEEKIHKIRIKREIKFWYTKKQNLNKTLYNLHIKNTAKNRGTFGT
jgi:hypothetical protein